MIRKELLRGNEAVAKAAIIAGCTHFFGYPITPASDIDEAAATYFPAVGRTFIQAESEIAAVNMAFGASAAGKRTMSATSGPGMSLMMEGLSYLAGAELPHVIVDVMRTGPGLGNVWPEQSDYNQIVKGGGHGNYKNIVLAPNCAQEMCDLTIRAFDLADMFRNVAIVLTDGCIGQTMEQVLFPDTITPPPKRTYAVDGTFHTRNNLITSIYTTPALQYALNERLQKKYALIEETQTLFEENYTEDASLIVVSYGITSRLCQAAVNALRSKSYKIGFFRPITLFPFPKKQLAERAKTTKKFVVAELSNGQMIDDVTLSIKCSRETIPFQSFGGIIPTVDEIQHFLKTIYERIE